MKVVNPFEGFSEGIVRHPEGKFYVIYFYGKDVERIILPGKLVAAEFNRREESHKVIYYYSLLLVVDYQFYTDNETNGVMAIVRALPIDYSLVITMLEGNLCRGYKKIKAYIRNHRLGVIIGRPVRVLSMEIVNKLMRYLLRRKEFVLVGEILGYSYKKRRRRFNYLIPTHLLRNSILIISPYSTRIATRMLLQLALPFKSIIIFTSNLENFASFLYSIDINKILLDEDIIEELDGFEMFKKMLKIAAENIGLNSDTFLTKFEDKDIRRVGFSGLNFIPAKNNMRYVKDLIDISDSEQRERYDFQFFRLVLIDKLREYGVKLSDAIDSRNLDDIYTAIHSALEHVARYGTRINPIERYAPKWVKEILMRIGLLESSVGADSNLIEDIIKWINEDNAIIFTYPPIRFGEIYFQLIKNIVKTYENSGKSCIFVSDELLEVVEPQMISKLAYLLTNRFVFIVLEKDPIKQNLMNYFHFHIVGHGDESVSLFYDLPKRFFKILKKYNAHVCLWKNYAENKWCIHPLFLSV